MIIRKGDSRTLKEYNVTFIALQPVENKGVYTFEGTEEEAKYALHDELSSHFGESFKVTQFEEVPQLELELPVSDK
jgi:hypothetical protein